MLSSFPEGGALKPVFDSRLVMSKLKGSGISGLRVCNIGASIITEYNMG